MDAGAEVGAAEDDGTSLELLMMEERTEEAELRTSVTADMAATRCGHARERARGKCKE